jgi:hypothetical protein
MIIVELLGGLGNQMFQYAFGRYLALKNKTKLKLDTTAFGKSGYGTARLYELGVFNINAELATATEIKETRNEPPGRWLKKTKRWLKKNGWLPKKNFLREIDYQPEELLTLGDNAYLEGFFQNEKYFQPIADIIRDDFTLTPELTNFNPGLAEKIKNSNSISLHVRRGDYANDPGTQKFHGLLTLEYYRAAIKIIERGIKNPSYFVFSDDSEWCQTNLKMPAETIFISGKAYEDLILMSYCQHNIIANSSFSWWAAWLNNNKQKMIIAPKQWLANEKDNEKTKNMIPPNWVRI